MPTFDFIAGRVLGVVKAKDVRVLWDDGKLYVVSSRTDVLVLDTTEPKRSGGMWKAMAGDQAISMIRPGCGTCRRRVQAELGDLTLDDIKALVAVEA